MLFIPQARGMANEALNGMQFQSPSIFSITALFLLYRVQTQPTMGKGGTPNEENVVQ